MGGKEMVKISQLTQSSHLIKRNEDSKVATAVHSVHGAMLKRQKTEKLVTKYVNFRDDVLAEGKGKPTAPVLGMGLVTDMVSGWRRPKEDDDIWMDDGKKERESTTETEISSRGNFVQRGIDDTRHIADNAIDATLHAVDNAVEGARDVVGNTIGRAHEMVDDTRHIADNAIDATLHAVDSAVEGARDVVGNTIGRAHGMVNDIRSVTGATKIQAMERGRQYRQQLRRPRRDSAIMRSFMATKIQAQHRGKLVRKKHKGKHKINDEPTEVVNHRVKNGEIQMLVQWDNGAKGKRDVEWFDAV